MIEAKGIVKNYGNLRVLKGVDILIKKGEVVAITGKSGAGKSSLLHILGTLDQSDEGTILFEDNDISKYNNKELAKFRNSEIGFIFQFHQLLPEFSALENAIIPSLIKGESISEASKRAEELFEILGVSDRKKHKPSELSGGEQQRISIARSLINSPKIIFADEPSGNLDSMNANELHKLFFDLREQFKQTFVIVTHNEILADKADRKLVMQDGFLISN